MTEQDFLKLKEKLKSRKITGASIARQFDKSPGWINDILRGNYPYYGAFSLPHYLYDYFVELKVLTPPNTASTGQAAHPALAPEVCPECAGKKKMFNSAGYPVPCHVCGGSGKRR